MNATCRHCSISFTVDKAQFNFLERVSPVCNENRCLIPPPTLCPACRQQRRLAFRNERSYYKRQCDNCDTDIIAMYPEQTPFPVYCHECYWNTNWDPFSYGREYDLDRSFFAQFKRLQDSVPRLYFSSTNNENCTYSNHVGNCKNCYLLVGSMESENCHFGYRVFHSRDCLDCLCIEHCELCYECIQCEHCYEVRFGFNCHNVHSSGWVEHCYGSSDLLFCAGVHQGKYQILNQQFSEEHFRKKKQEILQSPALQAECMEYFEKNKKQLQLPTVIAEQCENCTGNYIRQGKNCHHIYDAHHVEDVSYGYDCGDISDSMDVFSVYGPGELNYEVYSSAIAVHHNVCIRDCWPAESLLYCDHCFGCKHCFGCIGLQKQTYCIFNVQYSKEEYEELVPRMIASMDAKREWGEFFPADVSPFPLEDTPAYKPTESVEKPFKLTKQEKAFYKQMQLPKPTIHPDERHRRRLQKKQQLLQE